MHNIYQGKYPRKVLKDKYASYSWDKNQLPQSQNCQDSYAPCSLPNQEMQLLILNTFAYVQKGHHYQRLKPAVSNALWTVMKRKRWTIDNSMTLNPSPNVLLEGLVRCLNHHWTATLIRIHVVTDKIQENKQYVGKSSSLNVAMPVGSLFNSSVLEEFIQHKWVVVGSHASENEGFLSFCGLENILKYNYTNWMHFMNLFMK